MLEMRELESGRLGCCSWYAGTLGCQEGKTWAYLQDERLESLLVVLLSTQFLDLLRRIFEKSVELVIPRLQDRDSRVVERGRLVTGTSVLSFETISPGR
jgi:hypothetical protein